MMPCEDVRNLIEEHLADTLDDERRQEVVRHLQTCPACHRALEEARLAAMVLREASTLPPPAGLAESIKAAARTRLFYRPRPFHERAFGSPAFMATCASLLCGAIICLAAILRVGSVPSDPDPVSVAAAAPVEVHSLVRVERQQPRELPHMAARVSERRPQAPPAVSPRFLAQATASRRAGAHPGQTPREAHSSGRTSIRAVSARAGDTPQPASLTLAVQRTSLPEPVFRASYSLVEPVRSPSPANDLPTAETRFTTVDLAGAAAALQPRTTAAVVSSAP